MKLAEAKAHAASRAIECIAVRIADRGIGSREITTRA
jgi:hypothetical protein